MNTTDYKTKTIISLTDYGKLHFIGDAGFGFQPAYRNYAAGFGVLAHPSILNDHMIDTWNERVGDEDIVIALGSFILADKSNERTNPVVNYHALQVLLSSVKGTIILFADEGSQYNLYKNILELAGGHFNNEEITSRFKLVKLHADDNMMIAAINEPYHYQVGVYEPTLDAIGLTAEIIEGGNIPTDQYISISVDGNLNDGYGPLCLSDMYKSIGVR